MLLKATFPDPGNTDLNLYKCGIEDCEPGHQWGPGVRDHHVIHYILSGRGIVAMDPMSVPVRLAAGDGFLIVPGRRTLYRADDSDPWSYAWVGFNGLKAEALLHEAGLSPRRPTFHLDADSPEGQALAVALRRLPETAAGERRGREARLLSGLYGILAQLSLVLGPAPAPGDESRAARQELYVRQAVEYIARNYAGPLTIRDVAHHVGLDRSYLYALFREQLRMTPKEYLVRFRVERACGLLAGPLSIAEIGRSVGYEDPLSFSRVFRQVKGLPPSRYRNRSDSATINP